MMILKIQQTEEPKIETKALSRMQRVTAEEKDKYLFIF